MAGAATAGFIKNRFTAEEDAYILRTHPATSLTWNQIAANMGRANLCARPASAGASVRQRYILLCERAALAEMRPKASEKKRRVCACGRKFMSQHFGVRKCDKCRAAGDDVSPFAPDGCPNALAVHRPGVLTVLRDSDARFAAGRADTW